MKIKDTELEYTEADAVVLDYYLGTHCETKEQWGQRVVAKCREFRETNGKGYDGEGMSKCFARTPEDIWEEKKTSRRIVLMRELKKKELNDSEKETFEKIKNPKMSVKMVWSKSHSDAEVMKLLDDPRYSTATKRHEDMKKGVI